MAILTAFSSSPLSWVLHEYPNHVYASNLSCLQITSLVTCEQQQNGLRSSDRSSGEAGNNDVDGSTSTSNNEDDEIPLIIPNISPTLDESENDEDDGDEGSGQQKSEGGDDEGNGGEGNDRASNPNDNDNEDLGTTGPLVLPFP